MKKRNLFRELKRGIKESQAHDKAKITLRTYKHEKKEVPQIDADLIRDTREKLHLSRAVFAARLRIQLRTLEKWEQGKTVPNDQATVLILMVRKYPDTLNRLEKI